MGNRQFDLEIRAMSIVEIIFKKYYFGKTFIYSKLLKQELNQPQTRIRFHLT